MDLNFAGMYYQWIDAWNGEDIDLENIFHPHVVLHQMPHEHTGIEAVRNMITQGRAPFDPVMFTVEVDPIFDDHMLAARWKCHGTYKGGMPDVSAEPGKPIVFGGIDIWRFSDNLVSDYWVSSDGLWLMKQLNG